MKGKTFDTICGACASIAAYGAASIVLNELKERGGVVTRTGCVLIQLYIGLGVGDRVAKKTKIIREALSKMIDEG